MLQQSSGYGSALMRCSSCRVGFGGSTGGKIEFRCASKAAAAAARVALAAPL